MSNHSTRKARNTWTVTVVARMNQSATVTTTGTRSEAVAAAKAAGKASERWGSERWTVSTASKSTSAR